MAFYNSAWRYRWYEATRSLYLPGRKALIQQAVRLLPFDPKQSISILDLGCGTGWMLQQMADHYPNATLYGVDASFGMLSVAHERLIPYNNRTWLGKDARQFCNRFDLMLCSYTFSQMESFKQLKASRMRTTWQ